MKILRHLCVSLAALSLCACPPAPSSNDTQRQQQETLLKEATSSVGMPAIHNFRERRLLKDIYEMRDQEGLITYTYLFSPMTGKLSFFCDSIGYGIPYSTQFTAPTAVQRYYLPSVNGTGADWGHDDLPQADPNGLFSPASADGTWVMCKDPSSKNVQPMYIEPRIVVSPFKLKVD